jgi:hypothetical protein
LAAVLWLQLSLPAMMPFVMLSQLPQAMEP